MRSLLVEDEFVTRMLVKELLSQFGDCDIAVDGEEAIDAIKLAIKNDDCYDLILLDIMMPKKNGLDVLKEVRELEAELKIPIDEGCKVIMTTALDDTKTVMGAFRNGCEAYIVKPVSNDKLLEQLNNLGFKVKSTV